MLDYDKASIAMRNCQRVRTMYPVKFLQVLPCPDCPDNVKLRDGQGKWVTMHMLDAIAFTKYLRRGQRRQAAVFRKAIADFKIRRRAIQP